MLTYQDALKTLTDYWARQGCLTVTPYNSEVGAGTMNPATVLRVLGPEPWRVAYTEPSVRPDDSRYGLNPNRLQQHTQFQVVLKPEPGNPQELYVKSLEALGINLEAHDVRFVEDNWAQPAIGAWGLGWEVWLDGAEITQFTYFQQVGGATLELIPVELTYGMERILMAVQGVDHFKDIMYAPGVTYGEIFAQGEHEWSTYYLDTADIETTQTLYRKYVDQATSLIEQRLPIPAHSYVLKSSQTFNILDARGAISTTERANAFADMRRLSREVAKLWLQRREELGHPMAAAEFTPGPQADDQVSVVAPAPPRITEPTGDAPATGAVDTVVEFGFEELPRDVMYDTLASVRESFITGLDASRLEFGDVTCTGTPRRVVVHVTAVGEREDDATVYRKGPKWQAAFDADGEPTRALQGFLRGQGVTLDDVEKRTFGSAEHVSVAMTQPGRTAHDVLAETITNTVSNLRAGKNMRWNDPELAYSRALRWIVALRGDRVIDARCGDVHAGRTTYLRRIGGEGLVECANAHEVLHAHERAGFIVDPVARRDAVLAQARSLAAQVGGVPGDDAGLVDEIVGLTEAPVGVLGSFDAKYLELPEDILVTVMRKHQRYLPVRDTGGTLMNYFITMADGPCDADVVAAGNANVLRARYEDALFFFNTDLKTAPSDFRDKLNALTFENRLGSVKQRAERIERLAHDLGVDVQLDEHDGRVLERAGSLVKFDLATSMVIEMSSLAGTMAGVYAERAGESGAVAAALVDAERPRTTSDDVPTELPGALLALADRFDLLAAMFSLGAKPTGSSDPYGLRRAALGVVRVLREHPALAHLTISSGLERAAEALRWQGLECSDDAVQAAVEFVHGRFAQSLREAGVHADLVSAVAPCIDAPGRVGSVLADIDTSVQGEDLQALAAAVVRIGNIVPADHPTEYDPAVLTEPSEKQLVAVERALPHHVTGVGEFAREFAAAVPAINQFFDDVMVNAEDAAVAAARRGLLRSVASRAPRVVDWAALDAYLGQLQ